MLPYSPIETPKTPDIFSKLLKLIKTFENPEKFLKLLIFFKNSKIPEIVRKTLKNS
jgi:hypothetical protein